jgi:hypothetical protein
LIAPRVTGEDGPSVWPDLLDRVDSDLRDAVLRISVVHQHEVDSESLQGLSRMFCLLVGMQPLGVRLNVGGVARMEHPGG